jgi:hypothetical protein
VVRARYSIWILPLFVAGTAHAAETPSVPLEPAATVSSPNDAMSPAVELALRNLVLRKYVDDYVSLKNLNEGVGYGVAALGVAGLVVGVNVLRNGDHGTGIAWTAGFGATTLALGVSLAASRDTRVDVLSVLPPLDVGVATLGLAVLRDPVALPRLSMASASGAFFVLALFDTLNALARETKLSTLRRDRDRLDAGDVEAAELRTIERDFLGADVPFGPGVRAAPLGVGGAVALIPAFDSHYTQQQRIVAGVTGSALAVECTLEAIVPDPVPSYKRGFEAAGISLMASPTNIGFRYRF